MKSEILSTKVLLYATPISATVLRLPLRWLNSSKVSSIFWAFSLAALASAKLATRESCWACVLVSLTYLLATLSWSLLILSLKFAISFLTCDLILSDCVWKYANAFFSSISGYATCELVAIWPSDEIKKPEPEWNATGASSWLVVKFRSPSLSKSVK